MPLLIPIRSLTVGRLYSATTNAKSRAASTFYFGTGSPSAVWEQGPCSERCLSLAQNAPAGSEGAGLPTCAPTGAGWFWCSAGLEQRPLGHTRGPSDLTSGSQPALLCSVGSRRAATDTDTGARGPETGPAGGEKGMRPASRKAPGGHDQQQNSRTGESRVCV